MKLLQARLSRRSRACRASTRNIVASRARAPQMPRPFRGISLARPAWVLEIRIHGRGGQGVVTAAELLSIAAFREGQYAQSFPSFGSERMGAPVTSFCRVDARPIRLREPIDHPDVVVVQDPTLLASHDVFAGLGADGFLLVNSSRGFAELGLADWV